MPRSSIVNYFFPSSQPPSQPLIESEKKNDPTRKKSEYVFLEIQSRNNTITHEGLSNEGTSEILPEGFDFSVIDSLYDPISQVTEQPETPRDILETAWSSEDERMEDIIEGEDSELPDLIPLHTIPKTEVTKTGNVFNSTLQGGQKTLEAPKLSPAMQRRMDAEIGKMTAMIARLDVSREFFQSLADTNEQNRWENNEFNTTINQLLQLNQQVMHFTLQLSNKQQFLDLIEDGNSELYQEVLEFYLLIKHRWPLDVMGTIQARWKLGEEKTRSFYQSGTIENDLRMQHNALIDDIETAFKLHDLSGKEHRALLDKIMSRRD